MRPPESGGLSPAPSAPPRPGGVPLVRTGGIPGVLLESACIEAQGLEGCCVEACAVEGGRGAREAAAGEQTPARVPGSRRTSGPGASWAYRRGRPRCPPNPPCAATARGTTAAAPAVISIAAAAAVGAAVSVPAVRPRLPALRRGWGTPGAAGASGARRWRLWRPGTQLAAQKCPESRRVRTPHASSACHGCTGHRRPNHRGTQSHQLTGLPVTGAASLVCTALCTASQGR